MPITRNKKTSFKKKKEKKKKVLWEVFHMNENAPLGFFPHLISLYTHQDQRFAFSSTILLAMMLDEFYATQQIHQEQAKHHLHHSY